MVLENEEIERLMARKKAIQDTLAAQAQNPAPRQGGCSSGGCSSSAAAAPRKALLQNRDDGTPRAVLVLTLLRAAGLAAAAGVGLWALVQAL
ncbi:MAG: hypothetical protein KAY08_02620 [Giesbergeria sp.]|jgi:hypothetical protein|nr:hypothetical protein [Giesbergeria sp.]MBP8091708.1 hypothetical protein [Giesbergeria sp.]